MRRRIVGGAVCGLLLGSLLLCYFAWKIKVDSFDFKAFAEQKVGKFLKADVSISEVKLGLINRVALSGLKINPADEQIRPYDVSIQEIVFQYDLLQVFTQNLYAPSSIVLEAPEISVPGELFPYEIFRELNLGPGAGVVMNLKMNNGYVRYKIPALNTTLELSEVRGIFRPLGDSIFEVDFQANLRGFLEGQVKIKGRVNAAENSHDLELSLHEVSFGQTIHLPLHSINGNVRWENDNLYFESVDAAFHGWKAKLDGRLEGFTRDAVLDITAQVGKGKQSGEISLYSDLGSEKINLTIRGPGDKAIEVIGKIRRNGLRYEFFDLRAADVYGGDGWLDFETGDYRFHLFNEKQKIWMHSNLKGMDLKINAQLEHVKVYGLDLVASVNMHLIPFAQIPSERLWKFQGTFYSDLFILEYTPFNDFRGSFEAGPYGIKNFLSSWGKVFNLRGGISFRGRKSEADFVLKVEGFDLKNVEEFANKPLPKALGGFLEGKLKINGELHKPEILGNFTVKEGFLGKVDYDLGLIQFRGFPPYLKLYDSRVMKGRSTLSLDGAIDLSLPNIFHGVEIRTPEKFAVWKGWQMGTDQKGGRLDIGREMLPNLMAKTGSSEGMDRVHETAQKEEESYLVVGPSVRF